MNKKLTIILISLISAGCFAALLYYGLRHSRGVPVQIEKAERVAVDAQFKDVEIAFENGISLNEWDSMTPKEIKLMHQVMALPWGKSLVSPITVKVFHNRKDIYFYIRWRDDTENRIIGINKFSDACAVMFPMDEGSQPSTIMMGFLGKSNIWQWKASQDMEYWLKRGSETEAYSDFYYPFEKGELFAISKDEPASSANDLMAIRVGTITPKERQDVEARGFWKDGSWHVVFKRSFKAVDTEIDAVFTQGENKLCAFGVWNGEQGDRGGRKSISDWVGLRVH